MRTLVSPGATLEAEPAKNIALVKAEVHIFKGNDWLAGGGAHPMESARRTGRRATHTGSIIDANAGLSRSA